LYDLEIISVIIIPLNDLTCNFSSSIIITQIWIRL